MFGFDLIALIKAGGYLGLSAIVFAESGLFFGFFLPGDSLLFTAGFLASQGFLNIWILVPLMFVSAVAGDQVGYWFGARVGTPLFERPNSRFFKQAHLVRAQHFFEIYGARALILARFIPVVRTFTPIVAGVARMHYRTFVVYNVVGGLLWGAGMTLAGYLLGSLVPNAEHYMLPIVVAIIVVSVLPPLWHLYCDRRRGYKP